MNQTMSKVVHKDEEANESALDAIQIPRGKSINTRLPSRRPCSSSSDSEIVPSPTSAQTSKANDHWAQRFTDGVSVFCGAVLELVLVNYGLVLSSPLFWLSWIILVTKGFNYLLQSYSRRGGTRNPYRLSNHDTKGGAVLLEVVMSSAVIILLLYSQDMRQRENTILLIVAALIILFEGFTPLLMGREELKIIECQKWNPLLTPSAIDAMILVTGPIVLGGDLGRLMCLETYWVFCFIYVVDLLARSLSVMAEDVPKIYNVVFILRLVVEGFLCCWLSKEIFGDSYLPSHVDINASNRLCQERIKQLLITMVALGGFQAAVTFHHFCKHFVEQANTSFNRQRVR